MRSEQENYNELAYYTLSHPDHAIFIHQYIVDALTAQNADDKTKPIAITFALVGLYLCVEKNYSGKEVQNMHIFLAKKRKKWPTFKLPIDRGSIRAADVLAVPPGPNRDEMIKKWCESVWSAYKDNREQIVELLIDEMK